MNKKFLFGFASIFTVFVALGLGSPINTPRVFSSELIFQLLYIFFMGFTIALILNGIYLFLRNIILALIKLIFK